jgi:NAD(P)-dependent dehydrogenase (short-subunit alcohol dehydrogenase family)
VKARFGALDALVNNAGHAVFKPALETTLAEFQRTLDVNLTGPFLMTKAAVPLMAKARAIVNITSISGCAPRRCASPTAPARPRSSTDQAARARAVGARHPRQRGRARPGRYRDGEGGALAAIRADYHDAIPLGRYGLEEELAEAVFFLCSERASYITGQTLAVDGGFDAIGIGLPTFPQGSRADDCHPGRPRPREARAGESRDPSCNEFQSL